MTTEQAVSRWGTEYRLRVDRRYYRRGARDRIVTRVWVFSDGVALQRARVRLDRAFAGVSGASAMTSTRPVLVSA